MVVLPVHASGPLIQKGPLDCQTMLQGILTKEKVFLTDHSDCSIRHFTKTETYFLTTHNEVKSLNQKHTGNFSNIKVDLNLPLSRCSVENKPRGLTAPTIGYEE